MIRGSVCCRAAAMLVACLVVLASSAGRARGAAPETDDRVLAAEAVIRLQIELSQARIQRAVSAGVVTVMGTRPATSFRVRNAVQAAQNAINAAAREEIARIDGLVGELIDGLFKDRAPIIDISRLSDRYDDEVVDALNGLARLGVRDVASLLRNGRRVPSVRGTVVDRYELFVSQPENGRAEVRIGEVTLGESQMVRGLISTSAVLEFFLGPLEGPTPRIRTLPAVTTVRAVRWLYRSGSLTLTGPDSDQAQTFVGVDQNQFSIKGVDLLPERLRIELERRLEDSPDITSNIDGADGFFRSVTYTFRRVVEDGR